MVTSSHRETSFPNSTSDNQSTPAITLAFPGAEPPFIMSDHPSSTNGGTVEGEGAVGIILIPPLPPPPMSMDIDAPAPPVTGEAGRGGGEVNGGGAPALYPLLVHPPPPLQGAAAAFAVPTLGPPPPLDGDAHGGGTSVPQGTSINPAIFISMEGSQALPPSQEEDSPTGSASPGGTRHLYTCKECNKQFTLKGNLKRHVLTHAGVKPFRCETCDKGFSRKADLEIHQRVHTGEKPYSCPYTACGKKFARISDLRSHERTHSGIKAFQCGHPGCDRHFARRYDMKKHMKVHSKEGEDEEGGGGGGRGGSGARKERKRAAPKRQPSSSPYQRKKPRAVPHKYQAHELSSEDDEEDEDEDFLEESDDEYVSSYGRGGGGRGGAGGGGGGSRYRRQQPLMPGGGYHNGDEEYPTADAAAQRMQALRGSDTSSLGYPAPPRGAGGNGAQNGGIDALSLVAHGTPLNRPNTQAAKARKDKPTEANPYTRVLHNSHVDMLSPIRVLECREANGKSNIPPRSGSTEPSTAPTPAPTATTTAPPTADGNNNASVPAQKGRLTDQEISEAQRNCHTEHASPGCTCVQIVKDGLVHYVVNGKLQRRDEIGELKEYGDFRVLDEDFLAFYEGIESLVQDQPVAKA